MNKYEVGQTVFMGRGDKLRELVVAQVHDNPLIPIFQYSFEAPDDGFACGEQSLREFEDDPDSTLADCMQDTSAQNATRINTIAAGQRGQIDLDDIGGGSGNLFFKPSLELCEWLRDYAAGRMIIDVGSGQGHLVRMLKMTGARSMGIEPNFDAQSFIKTRMLRDGGNADINEILEGTAEDWRGLINSMGMTGKAMLVFARPCHSDFVEDTIYHMPKEMEALYITLPENLTLYNDLGVFKKNATLVDHKGVSEDNEVIYSIKKQ